MDLVRGLRKENLTDLALEYLDSLKASKIDNETAQQIDLEYARTWLDQAANETEENKRSQLIAQAKRKLEAFISARPKDPMAVHANIDLGRLYLVQGKTQIRKARRAEKKEREEEMKVAQPLLKAAAEKYKASATLIDEQIKKVESAKGPDSDRKRLDLLEFRLNSQLDEGITYYYLGETYIGDDTADVKEQGKQYSAAKKIFERIRYEDEKLPIRWIAMAWMAQADLKGGDGGSSEKTNGELLAKKATTPAAAAGIRLARYFMILNNLDTSLDYVKLEKDTESWLKDYPAFKETAEGLGCRYYLAISRRNAAMPGLIFDKKDNKLIGISTAAKAKLEQAQLLFKELGDSDNEYAERSNRNRSQILVTIADAEGHGDAPPVASLPNFERAYLMAQVQIARFGQFRFPAEKTPPSEDEIKKQEKVRFNKAIEYLERALDLANPSKDNIRDIVAAQSTLVGCYLQLKLYPQAAILAEYIARENPKLSAAPKAGSTAVVAYNLSQIELKKLKANSQDFTDEKLRLAFEKQVDDGVKVDVEHLRRAAGTMINRWPTETATDESRHIYAFYSLRDKKYLEAWKSYAGIRNSYPAVQAARLELASVMFTLVYPADEKDPAKFKQIVADRMKQYSKEWKQTISLLESVPTPDENAQVYDILPYLDNRAQLARLYQLEDNQETVEKIAKALLKDVDKFSKLSEEQKAHAKQTAQNLELSSVRAQALHEFKMGNHARVAEMLDPRIEEIDKEFAKKAPDEPTIIYQKLRQTQRETVALALQSSVKDGKIDRAGQLLDLLEKSGGSPEESLSMLQTLVANVRKQVDELEAEVKLADKAQAAAKMAEAESLKEGFAKLLEKLIARGDALPMKMKLFLASGLGSVGAYDKATIELEKIRRLPVPPMPTDPGTDATDAQQAKYKRDVEDFEGHGKYQHSAQFLLARNYWKKKDYTKALAVFKEMIGETSAKAPIPKEKGWAFASLQIRKEKAQMLEEMALGESAPAEKLKRWGEAVQEWILIAKTFSATRPEALRQQLPPQDEAWKVLKKTIDVPREDKGSHFCLLELAWIGHQYGQNFKAERAKFAADAEATLAKRSRYFDIYFEQKRCSVRAFKDLGSAATKGDANALREKFANFAKEFVELQSKEKNPDLPQSIKDRIKELVDSVEELKKEYNQLVQK